MATCTFVTQDVPFFDTFTIHDTDKITQLRKTIKAVAIDLIENHGVDEFIVRLAPGGDMWFAGLLLSLKKYYPQIKLEADTPYVGIEKNWPVEEHYIFNSIQMECDKDVTFQKDYSDDVLQALYIDTATNVDYVISVWDKTPNDAGAATAFALEAGAVVYNVDPNRPEEARVMNIKEE